METKILKFIKANPNADLVDIFSAKLGDIFIVEKTMRDLQQRGVIKRVPTGIRYKYIVL